MIRAPTSWGEQRQKPHTLQLNTAAPQTFRRRGEPAANPAGLRPRQLSKLTAVFYALFRAAAQAAGKEKFMAFFNSAVGVLQTLVVALGAGLGIWGVINLMEGYGNDNRATRS